MDLLSVGNLNHYIKTLKFQTQWTLKQQSGNYEAKGGSLEEWLDSSLSRTQEAEDVSQDHGDDTLRKIHQKLEAGGKLTLKERDYLQDHDPEAYRELVNLEREQKAYERELRRCRTQEEVEQLRMTRINASLTCVRAVENNPHIPLSKKLEIAMTEKQRVDRVAESTQKFVKSGEYAKLPTHAEEMEANEDAASVSVPKEPQQPDPPATSGKESDQQPGQEEKKAAIDVESTEERKVRLARAKAAYAANSKELLPSAPDILEIRM